MTSSRRTAGSSLLPCLALLGLASACLGSVGERGFGLEEEGPPKLRLTASADTSDARLGEERIVLESSGGGLVHPACGPYGCEGVPLVRVDAMQEDGGWIDRGDYVDFASNLSMESSVGPGAPLVIGTSWQLTAHPGTFRQVARVEDEAGVRYEVSRELAVVGWGEETLAAARDLLARADEARCALLRSEMMHALAAKLEPDPLLDLRSDAREDERMSFTLEMVQRGSFVHELVPIVTVAPMDDVRAISYLIRARGQDPVRSVVARRFFELVTSYEQTPSMEDYYTVSDLVDVWPEDAPEMLVARLTEGPDDGDDLAELIDTLLYVDRDLFASHTRTILDALATRCASAGERLQRSCEMAVEHFSAELPMLGGRGFGTSSGCGGVGFWHSTACDALVEEWRALEERAGELEVHELGDHVVRVD